jgi:transposase
MFPRWRKRVVDALSQKVYNMVIKPDHFLQRVEREVDLSFINALCAPEYKNGTEKGGRPAEEPERVFRALLLMILYQIPYETVLVEAISLNLAFRWFLRMGLLEKVFDHSLFYVVRDRLGPVLFEEILTLIFQQCLKAGLIGHQWVFYDFTDIEAAAACYTPYERAVILARAVMRLLEERPSEAGDDPTQPPQEASPALKRLAAEVAKEVVKAKKSKVKNILKGVERLEEASKTHAEKLPHRERVARALAEGRETPHNHRPETLQQVMEQLKAEMPHAKGDAEAKIGHTSRDHRFCGYLSGNLADGKYRVLSATHLEPGNVYQAHAFVASRVAEQHLERAGRAPARAALDAAFGYPEVAAHLAKEWPQTEVFLEPGVIPPKQPAQKRVFGIEAFTLTKDDHLLCPNEELPLGKREMHIQSHRKDGTLEYAGNACSDCPLRPQCTTKKKGPRVVKLHPDNHRYRQAIEAKAKTPEHRVAMRRLFAFIEPVFGHGKTYHRWGKAPYRSLRMNRIFNLLVVIVWDIEKLVRYAPVERQRRLACASP